MKEIDNYNKAFIELVEKFVKTYYTDDEWYEEEYHIIWGMDRLAPYTVWIWDEFWDVGNIWEALHHKIPESRLLEWYYDVNMAEWENYREINLVSFHLWAKKYSKSEIAKSEKDVKKAKENLFNELKKYEKS